jgi:hypothetical protein
LWTREGRSYDARLELGLLGFSRVQTSKGVIGPRGLEPLRFGDKTRSEEAAHFQRRGIPSVVCGPGSIAQAHKPDEYVEVDQLLKCEAFLRRLMTRMCAPA